MPNQHYPSLFVLLNTHEAKWQRLTEDRAEQIHTTVYEKEKFSDHEGLTKSSGRDSSRGGTSDLTNQQREFETLQNTTDIVKQTVGFWKAEKFVHLACAVPKELKNLVAEEFKKALPGVEVKYIFGNHTYLDQDKVRELFRESLKVV
jgi:hypothetical protein